MVEAIAKQMGGLDAQKILEHVAENYKPEDVFDKSELGEWAEANGYVPEEE